MTIITLSGLMVHKARALSPLPGPTYLTFPQLTTTNQVRKHFQPLENSHFWRKVWVQWPGSHLQWSGSQKWAVVPRGRSSYHIRPLNCAAYCGESVHGVVCALCGLWLCSVWSVNCVVCALCALCGLWTKWCVQGWDVHCEMYTVSSVKAVAQCLM